MVDDSLYFKSIPYGDEKVPDDAPTVAKVTYDDENTRKMDEFKQHVDKWKKIEPIVGKPEKPGETKVNIFKSLMQKAGTNRPKIDTTIVKTEKSDSDTSPPRKVQKPSGKSPPRKRHDSDSDASPPRERIRVRYRRGFDESCKKMLADMQKRVDEEHKRWNTGVVQTQRLEEKVRDTVHEMGKREDDPLWEYIDSKKRAGKPQVIKPKYEGAFPVNRFNIRPGYRWDSVDRSNGFERQWFERQNALVANQEERYKWSTEDM